MEDKLIMFVSFCVSPILPPLHLLLLLAVSGCGEDDNYDDDDGHLTHSHAPSVTTTPPSG